MSPAAAGQQTTLGASRNGFMGGAGAMGVASGPASGLRFAQTRGRIQGSNVTGVNYPSPFFDVAHTYLPVTVKQLFKWCRYYFLTNPLINATVFKLAEYPVTDIIIEHESQEVKRRWTEYFHDHLRFRGPAGRVRSRLPRVRQRLHRASASLSGSISTAGL